MFKSLAVAAALILTPVMANAKSMPDMKYLEEEEAPVQKPKAPKVTKVTTPMQCIAEEGRLEANLKKDGYVPMFAGVVATDAAVIIETWVNAKAEFFMLYKLIDTDTDDIVSTCIVFVGPKMVINGKKS